MINRLKDKLREKTSGTVDFFLSSDGESIPFGKNWMATIQDALAATKIAFVFLSPNSVNSTWVHFEAGFIYSKGKRVVPVGILGIDLGRIAPPLNLLQGFNVHSPESLRNILRTLNDEFETHYKEGFTKTEYDFIFGSQVESFSYFKNDTALIDTIRIVATAAKPVKDALKDYTEKAKIEGVWSSSPRDQNTYYATYGLKLEQNVQNRVLAADISPDTIHLHLKLLDAVFQLCEVKPPYKIEVWLKHGSVRKLQLGHLITGKIYKSLISITDEGKLKYGELIFDITQKRYTNGISCILLIQCHTSLQNSRLNELVSLLFELGVLKYTPESES